MIVRRLALTALGGALAVGMAVAGMSTSTVGAQTGGGCQLSGTATITPGLTTTAQSFTYKFSGTLSACKSNTAGAPTAGSVFAGVDPNGQVATTGYPSGSGSCGSSTTGGIAVAQFNDGSTAVIAFTTSGAGPAVALRGNVIPSVSFGTDTYTTSAEWAGDTSTAALTFQPASGQDCVTTPVTTAAINGLTALGSA